MKNDRDRMKCIISETIVALCNSGLDFSSELCVEGLLGITLDGRDILLVNINEVIRSGVSGAKTIPPRNVDSESESVFSEVTTSSDPKTVPVKAHARKSATANRSREQIPSTNVAVGRQTDPFPMQSLTSVKSEPAEIVEDDKTEVRAHDDVPWSEHGMGDTLQPCGADMDESYLFVEQGAEDQLYCKMDTSNSSEQFCDLSEPCPEDASSLPVVQRQTHPICLYSNTAPGQGASTSSGRETHHAQMSSATSQFCLQGLGDVAAPVDDNFINLHGAGTSGVANESTVPEVYRPPVKRVKRGRPYTELSFKITCLDKPYDSLNQIRHDDLRKIGLGIPHSEVIGSRRVPTRLPITWTEAQLREKIRSMFPRLQRFTLMHGNHDRKLAPIVSTTVEDLKKEVLRGALYVVPDGPLKPDFTLQ